MPIYFGVTGTSPPQGKAIYIILNRYSCNFEFNKFFIKMCNTGQAYHYFI